MTTGDLKVSNARLTGFDLASKMSAISALSGTQTGSDTSIQNLSTDARVAPDGVRTQNINLTVPALGTVTGNGTISPAGGLDYKMNASLSGGGLSRGGGHWTRDICFSPDGKSAMEAAQQAISSPLLETSVEAWQRVQDINAKGVFL